MDETNILNMIMYRTYEFNRLRSPNREAASWKKIFPDADEYEEHFQKQHNEGAEDERIGMEKCEG